MINPQNTDELYVASALEANGGIFYSNDAGINWRRIDSEKLKLPSHRIWSLAFDPSNTNRIFAGTHSSGVYVFEREGRTATTAPSDSLSRPRVSTKTN